MSFFALMHYESNPFQFFSFVAAKVKAVAAAKTQISKKDTASEVPDLDHNRSACKKQDVDENAQCELNEFFSRIDTL